ncbi:hypothetical protein ONS95_008497 [Cadophora gregata]|uniref:uncharacterized protein n=1 Tax=Cadophora gregata TaxID=51156 RepID=UPI0026DB52C0|nr:uncharacterized protein ONS95_008497 [Cadophora gregata]KAK0100158.1 hypothetical protein ONS95_008497 [Cadophora gregata]
MSDNLLLPNIVPTIRVNDGDVPMSEDSSTSRGHKLPESSSNGFAPHEGIEGLPLATEQPVETPTQEISKKLSQSEDPTSSTLQNKLANIANAPTTSLRKRISDALKETDIGFGFMNPKPYVSAAQLEGIITNANTKKALHNASDEVLMFANQNPKLLAITIRNFEKNEEKYSRAKALALFQSSRMIDSELPVEDHTSMNVCIGLPVQESSGSEDETTQPTDSSMPCQLETHDSLVSSHVSDPSGPCKHPSAENAFHNPLWDEPSFKKFYTTQWAFLVPIFTQETFTHRFEPEATLPFIVKKVHAGIDLSGGHFGDVTQEHMLASHQTAIKSTEGRRTIPVAVKKMRSSANFVGDWDREAKALHAFNELDDPHIVRGIGAFTYHGGHYIVMEWADRGDLHKVWKKTPEPHKSMTANKVEQFLKQFRGLAMALNQMHNKPIKENPNSALARPDDSGKGRGSVASNQDLSISSHLRVNRLTTADENWRHGDFKPANIVSVTDKSQSLLGRLKLADFGRAKQHMNKTEKRMGTGEMFTTWQYQPPEALDNEHGRSRLFDIWSFGCVLLETAIWMLFGSVGINQFLDSQANSGQKTRSLYWSQDKYGQRNPTRSATTFRLVERLLSEDSECKQRDGGSAFQDVIRLIKDKLIVLKLPTNADRCEPGCRINSKTLVEELDGIIEKGKQSQLYLFSGVNRDRVQILNFMPKQGRTEEQTNESKSLRASDTYDHDFDREWEFVDDSSFANRFLRDHASPDFQQRSDMRSSKLCQCCRKIDFNDLNANTGRPLTPLCTDNTGCEFCAMILRGADRYPDLDWRELTLSESGLKPKKSPGLPLLLVRRTEAKRTSDRKSTGPDQHNLALPSSQNAQKHDASTFPIQIGLPMLSLVGNKPQTSLILAWLDDCDKNHGDCTSKRQRSLPTRMIEVGTTQQPILRLVESASLTTQAGTSTHFIALSYRWGTVPPHEHLVTNSKVSSDHHEAIPGPLPQTLADAVEITRGLGIRYLWIDALCIVQGVDGDFAQEADRMDTVFSSAYCVIAATSADGSSSGFLNRSQSRDIPQVNEYSNPVWFPDTANPDGNFFVEERFDDFDQDVLQGPLNERGWVFQERALARRTIHFTSKQVYWECGEGIRC